MRFLSSFAGLVLLLSVPDVSATDSAAFAQARPALAKSLHDKTAAVRRQALLELRRYPEVSAARLALSLSRDPEGEVRQAALVTLAHLQMDPKVQTWMLTELRKDCSEANSMLAAALLAGEQEPQEVLALLNQSLKLRPDKLVVILVAARELGSWQDAAAVRAVQRLCQLTTFPKSLPLQRMVTKSLIGIRHLDTVPVLIDLTAKLEGEVGCHVATHLHRLTGANLGADTIAWKVWWQANRAVFRYPTAEALAAAQGQPEAAEATYYGLPIRARRLVFVVDTSGSMAGPRLEGAKKELVQALQRLPEKTEFNLLAFNSKLYPWSPRLVAATAPAKERAIFSVKNLFASGQTGTYEALRSALDMQMEAIYLLTDGAPTTGRLVLPGDILAAVQAQNLLIGSSIHVIGLAPGPEQGPFSLFLKTLAEQNHGHYRIAE